MIDPVFDDLISEEILFWYDAPLLFTTRCSLGNLFLVYCYGEEDNNFCYYVSTLTEKCLEGIKENVIPIRNAIVYKNEVWEVKLSFTLVVSKPIRMNVIDILVNLPEDGVKLYREDK